MNNKNNAPEHNNKTPFFLQHSVVLIYTISMFVVFPFYLTQRYNAARTDKYQLFLTITTIAAVCALMFLLSDYYSRNVKNVRESLKEIIKGFNCIDCLVILFFLTNLISSIFATADGGSFWDYFNGSLGRNMGVWIQLMLVVAYFIVSRLFYLQKYVLQLFMLGMAGMTLLAVLNFYHIDPLNIYDGYSASIVNKFVSTIGNKNMLSAMICVALPFSVGMSMVSDNVTNRIIAYVSVGIQFIGLIVATSDGGFLGCFLGIFILLIYACRDFKRLFRFIVSLAVMIFSSRLLYFFDLAMDGNNKGYTSFSELFVYNHTLWLVILPIVVALGALVYYININKERFNTALIKKVLFISVLAILALIIIVSAIMFAYVSNIEDFDKYKDNEFLSFFRFNEDWGTHRGFFWIKSFDIIGEYDFREFMFGSGPDSFREEFSQYNSELLSKYGESSSNAAHSVYINYFVTLGIWGFAVYVILVICVLVIGAKLAVSNPLALVCFGAIVAYAAQDLVNIANPINTPWFIMMIAICQSTRKQYNGTSVISDLL